MAQTIFDLSGLNGLAPKFYGDKPYASSTPNLRYLGADGQFAEGIYNPIARYGYLSPANNTTKAVSGTSSFLLTSAVTTRRVFTASTDSVFFADEAVTGTAGKVLNLDTALDTSLDTTLTLALNGGTNYAKIEDMILYQVNQEQRIFFLNHNTTTVSLYTMIGIADVDFSSPDEDWSSGTPVGASNTLLKNDGRHVFVNADNGFLYLLDGNTVHKIDGTATGGTNGTITPDVLVFLGSASNGGVLTISRLVDAVDLRGRMWIAVATDAAVDPEVNPLTENTPQNIGVYVWDRRTAVASMQDFVPILGVKEIKSMHIFQGQPACFTISTDGYTQFRVWSGTEFKVVQQLGKNSHPPYKRHSAHIDGDVITWIGNDGYVYCFGMIEGATKNALYIIGDMTAHVTSGQTFSGAGILLPLNDVETVTSGANTNGLAYYVSFKDTGGNHLKKWYPNAIGTVDSNAQVGHIGNLYTLVKPLPSLSTIKGIDIVCAPLGASGDTTTVATLKFYVNQSATPSFTKTVTRADIAKGYLSYELNKSYVTSFQIEIEWSTSQTLGANDFCPAYAVLEYEPTRTK